MTASAKKAKISREEIQLKRQGIEKLKIAQELTQGREALEALSEQDSTGRNSERLRTQLAVQLNKVPLEDSARVNAIDSRVAANVGVAARAGAEEEALGANLSLINADLGLESAATSSARVTAQSQAQLDAALMREAQLKAAGNRDILGAGIGFGLGVADFSTTDPLANPNQVKPNLDSAILTNPLPVLNRRTA
jgi:hypothetical protein